MADTVTLQTVLDEIKLLRKDLRKVKNLIEDPNGEKAKARSTSNGFNKPQKVSPELRAFLGLGAALAASSFPRRTEAAALSAADQRNVAAIKTMAASWKSQDVASRNSVFTTDAIRDGAEHAGGQRGGIEN